MTDVGPAHALTLLDDSGQGELDIAVVRDGPEAAALVRALREHDHATQVLLVTAAPQAAGARAVTRTGADDFLSEPLDTEVTSLRMRRAADRARLLRHEAELLRSLEERDTHYRSLFEASPDAILVVDEERGTIVDANRAAARLLGVPPEALVGRRRADFVGERAGHHFAHPAEGEAIPVELSQERVHGTTQPLAVHILHDLRQLVSERRAHGELAQQLRHAQKLDALGQLAAGIAHDFNNLLTVFSSSAQFLGDFVEQLPPGEAQRLALEDVAELRKAAKSGAGLTRQLLAFSRKDSVEPEVLDLNQVVEQVLLLLRRVLREDVTLQVHLDPRRPRVHMDRSHLEQVLANLAVNARDAMSAHGRLTIRTELEGSGDEQRAVLSVEDDGCGIPDAALEQIFEPYFSTKPAGMGTGLGLATVHGIVHQAGGRIEVSSTLGEGTSFRVRLPSCATRATPARLSLVGDFRAATPRRVLVVEDEAGVLRAMGRMLRKAGYAVLEANTVDRARELAETAPEIDALVTDVVMPGCSGPVLAEQLRRARPALPVLFVSAYADTMLDAANLKPGEAFLAKPFTESRFLARVREVLEGARPAA